MNHILQKYDKTNSTKFYKCITDNLAEMMIKYYINQPIKVIFENHIYEDELIDAYVNNTVFITNMFTNNKKTPKLLKFTINVYNIKNNDDWRYDAREEILQNIIANDIKDVEFIPVIEKVYLNNKLVNTKLIAIKCKYKTDVKTIDYEYIHTYKTESLKTRITKKLNKLYFDIKNIRYKY